jgi:pimeloyl-ACP methyl ester carboxylesterase
MPHGLKPHRGSHQRWLSALALGLIALPAVAQEVVGGLARSGDLGFRPRVTAEGRIGVAELRKDQPVTAAGLQVGDVIDRIGGRPVTNVVDWFAARRSVKGGTAVALGVLRDGQPLELRFVARSLPLEVHDSLTTEYTSVATSAGHRVRLIVTRPRAAGTTRLPASLFIPWLSCGGIDYPRGPVDGWARLLLELARDSGAVLVRVEKTGVGDSEGPDCADADLALDMAAYRAAIDWLAQAPGVDPDRVVLIGGSIGAALAPVLATERTTPVRWRGVVSIAGYAKTWLEHMLEIERRLLSLQAADPTTIDRKLRGLADFYSLYLNGRRTPREVIALRPDLAPLWTDEPARQYGRPAAYFHQVQSLDVWAAWSRVNAPVLLVHGTYDHIMSPEDPQLVAAFLNARRPGQASVLMAPQMGHDLSRYADAAAAFEEKGGEYDAQTAARIVEWVRKQLAAS